MKASRRGVSVSAAFLAFLLLSPLSARAQFRGGRMGAAHPVMRSIRMRPRPTHIFRTERAPIVSAAPRSFGPPVTGFGNQFGGQYGFGSGETLQQLLDPVPGLGFNYQYLNAINSDLPIKAVIDPETEWDLAVAERVQRATGGYGAGGYYLLGGGGDYIAPGDPAASQPQPSQPPQPTVIVLQEKAPQAEQAPSVAPQPATPLPNISNFTLVLQNGKKIQAIAFTRVGDQIVYITSDGARHTISASELNSSATEQINADSGTQLRL